MTMLKFKIKEAKFDSLADCNATVISSVLKEARDEKANMVKFSFGIISKVKFDVIVYYD